MNNVGVEVDQRPKKQYNDLSSPYVAYVDPRNQIKYN